MTATARLYIAATIIGGFALFAWSLWVSSFQDLELTLTCVLASIFSSGLKISLPRITGTLSVNFVFLLLAATRLSLVEAMTVAGLSATVQYVWHCGERTDPIKLAFNTMSLSLTVAASHYMNGWLSVVLPADYLAVRLGLVSIAYFFCNTASISGVLSVTSGKSFGAVWRENYVWSFSYYLLGASIVAGIDLMGAAITWQTCLVVLPILFAVHRSYRLYLDRLTAEKRQAELKQRFLANMSHEFRTPLNGVLGTISLLQAAKLSADQEEGLEIIRYSARSLLDMVDEILEFTSNEDCRTEIRRDPTEVSKIVASVLREVRPRADEKNLQLCATIDPSVPNRVYTDPIRVRRILSHLVGNAVKFTHSGRVQIRVHPNGSWLHFEVEDTGIGIEESNIPTLFQPLEQLDSSDRRQYGGTGLGLSISKRLVGLLGGNIGVQSTLDEGSTFWFTLPCSPVYEAPPAVQVAPPSPAEAHERRVLVVEDNKINQRVAVRLLQKLGYSPDVAENGQQALEQFEPGRYSVILMDCQMPIMDGFEATRQIRRRESDEDRTPIIAVTARALPQDQTLCLEAGMDAYVAKPVDLFILDSALKRYARNPLPATPQTEQESAATG